MINGLVRSHSLGRFAKLPSLLSEWLANPDASQLTNLNASQLASGTVPTARLSNVVIVLDTKTLSSQAVNTTTPTTMYSFSVPGGTLGTTRGVRLTGLFNVGNNSGGTRNLTLTIDYGGSTVVSGVVTFANVGGSNRYFGQFELNLRAQNSASAQRAGFHVAHSVSASDPNGAFFNGGNFIWAGGHRTLTVNSGSAQSIVVSAAWDVADATTSFILENAVLEWV